MEWLNPDALRDPWCLAMADYAHYPFNPSINTPWRDGMTTEVEYRGYIIKAVEHTGSFDKADTMGLDVPAAFTVVDDFGDQALPLHHHLFWSPWDARQAIDFYLWAKENINLKKWPTTPAHEFNLMLMYRRHFPAMFSFFHDLKKILAEARDFGDNPDKAINARLAALDAQVREWGVWPPKG